jgi:hypothetical protein
MEKWMCWGSVGVAGLLFLLFLLDLVLGLAGVPFQPFSGISYTVDVLGLITCAMLIYLSLEALREVK